MTWARLDDGFPSHQKVRGLSDAAFRLHVTAICDCARHLTDGVVLRDSVSTLQGAPPGARLKKAISELTSRGLWEETDSGWRIHDYLDWNPCAADVMAKRASRAAAGRRGGRRSGEERRAKQDPSKPEATAKQMLQQTGSKCFSKPEATAKQMLQQTGSKCFSKPEAKTNPVPVPVPVPGSDPDLKAAAEDLSGGARASEPEPPPSPLPDGVPGKIPCPRGLRLTDDQRGTLEVSGQMPGWAIDELTTEVVAGFQGDPEDRRPLAAWRKCLARAVSGRWNDPRRRRELLDARRDAESQEPTPDREAELWRPPPDEFRDAVDCPPEIAERLRRVGYEGPLAPTGSS